MMLSYKFYDRLNKCISDILSLKNAMSQVTAGGSTRLLFHQMSFFDLLEPWDVRALSISKTADLAVQLWTCTFPRFMAYRILFTI